MSATLDQMFWRWRQALQELENHEASLQSARRDAQEQEARFKGAIEALGGPAWSWEGKHVFVERAVPRTRKPSWKTADPKGVVAAGGRPGNGALLRES